MSGIDPAQIANVSYPKVYFVNAAKGNDSYAGDNQSVPLKTIAKALELIGNGGGTAILAPSQTYVLPSTYTPINNIDIICLSSARSGISATLSSTSGYVWQTSVGSLRFKNIAFSGTHTFAGTHYLDECYQASGTVLNFLQGGYEISKCMFNNGPIAVGSSTQSGIVSLSCVNNTLLAGLSSVGNSTFPTLIGIDSSTSVLAPSFGANVQYSIKSSTLYSTSPTGNALAASSTSKGVVEACQAFTPLLTPARINVDSGALYEWRGFAYDADNSTIFGTEIKDTNLVFSADSTKTITKTYYASSLDFPLEPKNGDRLLVSPSGDPYTPASCEFFYDADIDEWVSRANNNFLIVDQLLAAPTPAIANGYYIQVVGATSGSYALNDITYVNDGVASLIMPYAKAPSTISIGGKIFVKNLLGGWTNPVENVVAYVCSVYSTANYTLTGGFVPEVCRYDALDSSNSSGSANSWFNTSTYRFNPKVAGLWLVSASYNVFRGSTAEASLVIRKNGTDIASVGVVGGIYLSTDKTVYLNGTTDYIDVINVGQYALARQQTYPASYFQARRL